VEPSLRERLLADGWEERFSAVGARLDETADYYRSLGFEVRVERAVDAAADGSCTVCLGVEGVDGPVGVVFTRAASAAHLEEEDLFE